jgi:hypothetical protein
MGTLTPPSEEDAGNHGHGMLLTGVHQFEVPPLKEILAQAQTMIRLRLPGGAQPSEHGWIHALIVKPTRAFFVVYHGR